MKKNHLIECPFCAAEIKDPFAPVCVKCDFPLHGTDEMKENFRSENAESGQLIKRAVRAFNWARFGMLWPWLTAIIVAGYFLIRTPALVQEMVFAFSSSVIISSIFIFCYFTAPKKPVKILTLAFVLLLFLALYGLYAARMFLMFPGFWLKMLVPAILLLMYGNALFLMIKMEKELKCKKRMHEK